jgi:hypothetical protein
VALGQSTEAHDLTAMKSAATVRPGLFACGKLHGVFNLSSKEYFFCIMVPQCVVDPPGGGHFHRFLAIGRAASEDNP